MAVNWNDEQLKAVGSALEAHPLSSGNCERCAIAVRDIGKQLDEQTHCLSVRPSGRERFVVPKADLRGKRWYFHFTAHVCTHCVDVLTAASGTSADQYLNAHWEYPGALEMTAEEPSDD